ncbi:MAG: hypothetical protein NT028_07885 [candidate division Zixibacteria bacterium]|nr:hypothetical protein [candidate division Zixibacteria bacterium]
MVFEHCRQIFDLFHLAEEIELRGAYLGFVIARPLPDAVIGRTLLSHFEEECDDNPTRRRLFPCARDYQPYIDGMNLPIESLAFQEQDTVLAACATTALWSAFHSLSPENSTPVPSPAEITRSATGSFSTGRAIPSSGLTIQEICQAIKTIGLEPELLEVRPETPLLSALYAYVAGGIPAILVLRVGDDFHAVTVAGFSLDETEIFVNESNPHAQNGYVVKTFGLRIEKFYVHDDQAGPFSRLEPSETDYSSTPQDERPELNHLKFTETYDPDTGLSVTYEPYAVIFPVYHKLRVPLISVMEGIESFQEFLSILLETPPLQDLFVWNIRVAKLNAYKKAILETDSLSSGQRGRALITSMPKYMWQCECYCGPLKLFEILIDATDMKRSFNFHHLVFYSTEFEQVVSGSLQDETVSQIIVATGNEHYRDFLEKALSTG